MKATKATQGRPHQPQRTLRRVSFPALAGLTLLSLWLIVASSPTHTAAQPNSGEEWTRVAGSSIAYRSISMVNANEGWAVGSDWGLSHWDGVQWIDYPSQYLVDFEEFNQFRSVSAFDSTHAWAVGDEGMSYYWDGSSWTRGTMTTTGRLNGVVMVSQTEAWAVQNNGEVYHWTAPGLTWTRFAAPAIVNVSSNTLTAISASSPTDVWAVGFATPTTSVSGIYHYDGTSWSMIPMANIPTIPSARTLNAVHALSTTDIWVAGSNGIVWHSTNGGNSATFAADTFGTTLTIQGISMLPTGEGWAVGASNMVRHRSIAGTWTNDITNLPHIGHTWFAVATLSATEGWVVGDPPTSNGNAAQSARMMRRTGSNNTWAAVRGLQKDNNYLDLEVVNNGGTDIVYGVANIGVLNVFTDTTPHEISAYVLRLGATNYTGDLNGLDMISPTQGWAAGGLGGNNLVRWDAGGAAGAWTAATYDITPLNFFQSVFMLNANAGFAVTGNSSVITGTIYAKNSVDPLLWNRVYTGTGALYDVWALDAMNVYAVGQDGLILRTTDGGATWGPFGTHPSTTQDLEAISCMPDGSNCWAVGGFATAWRYDPGTDTWVAITPTKLASTTDLNDVAVVAADNVWAVGNGGAIVHFDGSRWTLLTPATFLDLNAIKMVSSTEGYIGGESGILLRYGTPGFSAPVADPVSIECRSAGPDAYGYRMDGIGCAGGPVFDWIPGTTLISQFGAGDNASWNSGFANITLPFSFTFYGTPYDTIRVGTNGSIGPSISASFVGACPSTSSPRRIQPFAGDLIMDVGDVYTGVSGTAPNRVFVIEWRNARLLSATCCTTPAGRGTFAALLFEGTNDIVVQYLDMSGHFRAGTFGFVGISDNVLATGHSWVCNSQSIASPNLANVDFTGSGVAIQFEAPEGIPTATVTNTPTTTDTETPTVTSTPTLTETPTRTSTSIPTSSNTPSITATGTSTTTSSPTSTATETSSPTNTSTSTATETSIPTGTPTPTSTSTNTATSSPTSTATSATTSTTTVTPTDTSTPIPTATHTPTNMATATATATAHASNNNPVVGLINAPIDPVQIGSVITASARFTDTDVFDTHTALWVWDDGTTSPGAVQESLGTGVVTMTHVYTQAGVYTLRLTVFDNQGGSGFSEFEYVVVYDPEGGFVTGGGWINSPEGAYRPDPTLTGRANFGFVSKYRRGSRIPEGRTEFNFSVANLNFHSAEYQWLVISGARAQYRGTGTINGAGSYHFMLTAIDGQAVGGGGQDKFRMKIWSASTGELVYDNQLGAPDDADPTTIIGGGSITIHRR